MKDNNYYVPHLEWEAINFPITISQIKFERLHYGFKEDTIITIWRNNDYQLQGKVSGYTDTPISLDNDIFVGKGNIIQGDTITGVEVNGNGIKLSDCILTGHHTDSWHVKDNRYFFEAQLILSNIKINFTDVTESKRFKRYDWFLCSDINADFDKTTFRNLQLHGKKFRAGLDEYDDSIENYTGGSLSRDYIEVGITGVSCIIAEVPEYFTPDGIKGICFEFRSSLPEIPHYKTLNCINNLVSFLLGNRLTYIGSSILAGNEIKEVILHSVSNKVNVKGNRNSMPPIKFNRQYDWGNFAWLMNNLLPVYLKLEGILSLNQVLSRYWIAKSIPVGSNLPVLANAIEILAAKYLKHTGKFKMENIPQNEYLNLIKEELETLTNKLAPLNGGNAMINKIKGANQKVPSEKITLFFSLLGIEVGKAEKAAINLRNKMAHSSRNYSDDDTAYDDLILTRVYEVLFNRVLLKLLGYDDYYIDYSVVNCPLKHITKRAGEE